MPPRKKTDDEATEAEVTREPITDSPAREPGSITVTPATAALDGNPPDSLPVEGWARMSFEAFGVAPEVVLNATSGVVTRDEMRAAIDTFMTKPIKTEEV